MSIVICSAKFRAVDNPSKFDLDLTTKLRQDLAKAGGTALVKIYRHSMAEFGGGKYKTGIQKEVWVKYQLVTGGKFFEKTFRESSSTHKSINVVLQPDVVIAPEETTEEEAPEPPQEEVAE